MPSCFSMNYFCSLLCTLCLYSLCLYKKNMLQGNRHYLSCPEIVIVSKLALWLSQTLLHDSRVLEGTAVDFRRDVCHAPTWHFGSWVYIRMYNRLWNHLPFSSISKITHPGRENGAHFLSAFPTVNMKHCLFFEMHVIGLIPHHSSIHLFDQSFKFSLFICHIDSF